MTSSSADNIKIALSSLWWWHTIRERASCQRMSVFNQWRIHCVLFKGETQVRHMLDRWKRWHNDPMTVKSKWYIYIYIYILFVSSLEINPEWPLMTDLSVCKDLFVYGCIYIHARTHAHTHAHTRADILCNLMKTWIGRNLSLLLGWVVLYRCY